MIDFIDIIKEACFEIEEKLSDKSIKIIAEYVEGWWDNKELMSYTPPNLGIDYEKEEMKKKFDLEKEKLEHEIYVYRNSVAKRRCVDVNDVRIEDDTVMFYR
jgi:hypothetical protein